MTHSNVVKPHLPPPPPPIYHRVPDMVYYYHGVPSFTVFCSMHSCFRVTGNTETSVSNDPKMTLNTKRSKVSHLHINCEKTCFYGQPTMDTHATA